MKRNETQEERVARIRAKKAASIQAKRTRDLRYWDILASRIEAMETSQVSNDELDVTELLGQQRCAARYSPSIDPGLETKRIAHELSANCLLDRRCGGNMQTGGQCTIESLCNDPAEVPEEWDQPSMLDRDQPSKLVGRKWAETKYPKQDE
jgi:hypothetical protein